MPAIRPSAPSSAAPSSPNANAQSGAPSRSSTNQTVTASTPAPTSSPSRLPPGQAQEHFFQIGRLHLQLDDADSALAQPRQHRLELAGARQAQREQRSVARDHLRRKRLRQPLRIEPYAELQARKGLEQVPGRVERGNAARLQ